MKKTIRDFFLSIWLYISFTWSEFIRGLQNASGKLFGDTFLAGKEQMVDEQLRQIQEQTQQEVFIHWTAYLGTWQTKFRHVLEDKKMLPDGSIVKHQYTNEEKADAEKQLELLEDELWEMAAEYNKGKIKEYIYQKLSTPSYTPHDLFYEDGVTWMINKETGEKTILENENEEKSKTAKVIELSPESDQER